MTVKLTAVVVDSSKDSTWVGVSTSKITVVVDLRIRQVVVKIGRIDKQNEEEGMDLCAGTWRKIRKRRGTAIVCSSTGSSPVTSA